MNTLIEPSSSSVSARALLAAETACARIAPVWPLQRFVAVNPFLGMADLPFAEAAARLQRVTHGSLFMPPAWFREQLQAGLLREEDLQAALASAGRELPADSVPRLAELEVSDLTQWLLHPGTVAEERELPRPVLTLAESLDRQSGTGLAAVAVEEVSRWCAAYFDAGQASWRMPWQDLPLFAAWRHAACLDKNPELRGYRGLRRLAASLPDSGRQALPLLLQRLDAPADGLEDYLHRLLRTVAGWSAHAQFQVRESARQGGGNDSLLDLLVIRLCFDACLTERPLPPEVRASWLASWRPDDAPQLPQEVLMRRLWLGAAEHAYQRRLLGQLTLPAAPPPAARPQLQAVFCIDVRSEALRTALESLSPAVETFGFAGFFGVPIECEPFDGSQRRPQCPVLLQPQHRVQEVPVADGPEQRARLHQRLQRHRQVGRAWGAFKDSAVSCFSFVETAGLGFGLKLVHDSFAAWFHGRREAGAAGAGSRLEPAMLLEEQVRLASGLLRNLGLTCNWARLVLLCGHGSSTRNNPYGASLDCGACGGHAGDANARVAAGLLNRSEVRAGLAQLGLALPEDTVFVAGLHDTTTDEVRLCDPDLVPPSHATDLLQLQLWLEEAGRKACQARARRFGRPSRDVGGLRKLARERSRDWSEVRPEWGLAGNAAFIAAPRWRTRHLDLHGRVFLHSYDAAKDPEFLTLEAILTAPVIVANWINLQYYASTVNNGCFGSGTKVTHNVVGTWGVVQGNGGDLRTGLPLQSLHDGRRWMHEPLRLSVIVEAPRERISLILARQPAVRQLADHGWLHLFALEDGAVRAYRYVAGNLWEPARA